MQPKMKKKKSVGKLEVKDTNKASKYVLTTQNADHRGYVETKLVKVMVRLLLLSYWWWFVCLMLFKNYKYPIFGLSYNVSRSIEKFLKILDLLILYWELAACIVLSCVFLIPVYPWNYPKSLTNWCIQCAFWLFYFISARQFESHASPNQTCLQRNICPSVNLGYNLEEIVKHGYILSFLHGTHRSRNNLISIVICLLIQGEVKPSAGGGSSVVFTEVETLKQTSPGDK